jgi:RNA 2',3'-cyclic 3'-phosphodiesterase
MKRLFFALWPDEKTRQQCFKIANAIRSDQSRIMKALNIHVTLLFLGNTDSQKEQAFKIGLKDILVPEITLSFDELNFWKKTGILCLTTSTYDPGLAMLVEALSKLAGNLNMPVDDRPLQPHVTLVRKAKSPVFLEFEPVIWHSNSFCLIESCGSGNETEYRIVEKWYSSKNKQ